MASFVVSALKYRPSTFRSVVGQDSLTATLKNAIKTDKLAHAYLFCGPRGVGKTTCARIFAKTINCENRTEDSEACNVCESCVSFNELRSYSIHELDAASNNGVDDIRSLTEQVRIPPQVGRYSVYIIDEVHMLSQGAFNAFLKTLEEPPKHAIFILATTEKHKIIPTILSRCQIYDFNRITIQDTVKHLQYVAESEQVTIEESALNIIAQKSDGGMRDALSIFDQLVSFSGTKISYQDVIDNLNVLDYEYYYRITNAFLEGNVVDSLLIFNEILNKGFDGHNFITGLSSYLRDLLVSKDPATIQLLEVGKDIADRYREQAASCSSDFLFTALSISNECDLNYRISKNKRLLVELALIKISQINNIEKKNLADPVSKKVDIQEVKPVEKAAPVSVASEAKPEEKGDDLVSEGQVDAVQTPIKSAVAPKHARPVSISISANIQKEEEREEVEVEVVKEMAAEVVTQEDLEKKWFEYSNEHRRDIGAEALLKSHLPELREGNIVHVVVDNIFQEKEMKEMNIISFLREELFNNQLKLEIERLPESEVKVRLTPQELFQKMAEENPLVEALRSRLEMEIDE